MRKMNLLVIFVFSVFFLFITAIPSIAQQKGFIEVRTKRGDGWIKLSERYDVKEWKELRKLNWDRIRNPERPNLIYPGQKFVIPVDGFIASKEEKPQKPAVAPLPKKETKNTDANRLSINTILVSLYVGLLILLFTFICLMLFREKVLILLFGVIRKIIDLLFAIEISILKHLESYDEISRKGSWASVRVPIFTETSFVGYDDEQGSFYLRTESGFFMHKDIREVADITAFICKGNLTNVSTNLSPENWELFGQFASQRKHNIPDDA